ncbi:MAG: bis(5'-nucleosyl)-tetraphosphatase (symmetrical) YqeK [Lachnospiraceae bacterium]
MDERISTFRNHLASRLDPVRYEHSLSVSFTCVALAMRYGYDINKAEIAGLLHDCAKRYSDKELIARCAKHGIILTEEEKQIRVTIHAKYGEWLARHKYHIQDEEILSAIRYHTTGRPAMSLLEKIVFVADFIEPRRFKASRLNELRTISFQNLDRAVAGVLDSSLSYLQRKGGMIDSMTQQAFEYYQKKERE